MKMKWINKQIIKLEVFKIEHPNWWAAINAAGGLAVGTITGVAIGKTLSKNDSCSNDISEYIEPVQIEGETDRDRMIRVVEFSKTLMLQDGEEYTITKRPDDEYERDKDWYREMFGKELSPNEVFHISAGDD